jgi:hypothetical protein
MTPNHDDQQAVPGDSLPNVPARAWGQRLGPPPSASVPPDVIPAPPDGRVPRSSAPRGTLIGVALLTVLVIGVTVWVVQSPDGAGGSFPAAPTRSGAALDPSDHTPAEDDPAPAEQADPESPPDDSTTLSEPDALNALQDLRRDSRSQTDLDGHYVAQLASKYPGLVSPKETSPSGDHEFTADEILTEHQKLQNRFGSNIILLLSTDYGKRQKLDGQALWVTFFDDRFSGSAEVTAWCRQSFPELSGGDLANACTPRTLRPKD